jgi:glycosyltransferase involved in cell wall biosynthesis
MAYLHAARRREELVALRFAILTQKVPPEICGIGDHSIRFAAALREHGHGATVLARQGTQADGVAVIPGEIGPEWLASVLAGLDRLGADHVVLQYTPLMYSEGHWRVERALLKCWRALGGTRPASVIVHETYFRAWRHPPSLLRGTIQKAFLKTLARHSRSVLTASIPLQAEMSGWRTARRPVFLPIGSNIPFTKADRSALRRTYGIAEEEIVLTLFGGGTSLRWSAHIVDSVERTLNNAKIPHSWLLLGRAPSAWFKLTSRVVDPGLLSSVDLSSHLQLTDLFLMPHVQGVSAKRGTLITALEHGLPVVGTKGAMTDAFWQDVHGVTLVDTRDADSFATAVAALCSDRQRRHYLGRRNSDYFRQELTWSKITGRFLDAIGTD